MGYGVTVFNDSGGLTLSSDGQIYGYIGQATHVSTVQPAGPMTGTVGWPSVADCGYSTYTIDWPGQIVAALPVKTNGSTALIDMVQSGSTWTMTVYKSNGSSNALGFNIQEATEVYVFGRPVAVSDFGLAIYNASGVLSGDLSRRPMTFDKFLSFAASATNASFSGLSVPAVVGQASWHETASVPFDSTLNDNRQYRGAWAWNSSSGLLQRQTFLWTYERSVAVWSGPTAIPATSAIVMESAGFL